MVSIWWDRTIIPIQTDALGITPQEDKLFSIANIIALTAEDGITNADGDPVTGNYAILPENEEGKSKLVAVAKGDDDAWSPSGETETIIPIQTDALTGITPQEGQSYYPTPEQEQEVTEIVIIWS